MTSHMWRLPGEPSERGGQHRCPKKGTVGLNDQLSRSRGQSVVSGRWTGSPVQTVAVTGKVGGWNLGATVGDGRRQCEAGDQWWGRHTGLSTPIFREPRQGLAEFEGGKWRDWLCISDGSCDRDVLLSATGEGRARRTFP